MEESSPEFLDIKEAFAKAVFPDLLRNFNMGTIVNYFVDSNDPRAFRENSFELFSAGHVKVC